MKFLIAGRIDRSTSFPQPDSPGWRDILFIAPCAALPDDGLPGFGETDLRLAGI
jgi:hypothetical protein